MPRDHPTQQSRQRSLATLQQPVTPLVEYRLADLVLAAHIAHHTIATQAGQHGLDLLLRRELPVLLLLARRPSSGRQSDHPLKTSP